MRPARPLDPEMVNATADRLWKHVESTTLGACWHYRHRVSKRGYGRIQCGGFIAYAHRFSWVLAHGRDIPVGLTVDHLCRQVTCVNPDHLEAVTEAENIHRTRGIYARTPKPYEAKSGVITWKVRYHRFTEDHQLIQTSKTFPSEKAARDWIAANTFRPLVESA